MSIWIAQSRESTGVPATGLISFPLASSRLEVLRRSLVSKTGRQVVKMVECGRCQGEGRHEWNEDGREVSDVCYRCGGTGKIDEESARDLQLEQVAGILASGAVEDRRKACNEDPDGEGWAFAAAESMMTELDYTTAMKYDYAARFKAEIDAMSSSMQDALLLALLPKPPREEAAPAPAPVPPAAPAPAVVNDDEIPF